jgi:hypothetical protein
MPVVSGTPPCLSGRSSSIGDPDLYEESVRSLGQLDDIRYCAHVLRETASDVLKGDFGVFASARAIVEGEALQQRIGEDAAMLDRNHRAAVTAAADAFRVRDFGLVVQLLTPQIEFLTPAERARLDYAGARVGRQDGAI